MHSEDPMLIRELRNQSAQYPRSPSRAAACGINETCAHALTLSEVWSTQEYSDGAAIRVRQDVQFRVQSALRVNAGSEFLGSAGVNSRPSGSGDQPCVYDWRLCLLVAKSLRLGDGGGVMVACDRVCSGIRSA